MAYAHRAVAARLCAGYFRPAPHSAFPLRLVFSFGLHSSALSTRHDVLTMVRSLARGGMSTSFVGTSPSARFFSTTVSSQAGIGGYVKEKKQSSVPSFRPHWSSRPRKPTTSGRTPSSFLGRSAQHAVYGKARVTSSASQKSTLSNSQVRADTDKKLKRHSSTTYAQQEASWGKSSAQQNKTERTSNALVDLRHDSAPFAYRTEPIDNTIDLTKASSRTKRQKSRIQSRHTLPEGSMSLGCEPLRHEVLEVPPSDAILVLSHGLEKVLAEPGIHPLNTGGHYHFPKVLQHIHQPQEVNFARMAAFVPPREDQAMFERIKRTDCSYATSTSSISGILAHIYYLLSTFRPLDTSSLSTRELSQISTFTRGSGRATSALLIPLGLTNHEGQPVYAIDKASDKTIKRNSILMDLGKSLERFLCMEPKQFEANFVKNSVHYMSDEEFVSGGFQEKDCYLYSRAGPFMLRSQLDCYDESLPGTTHSQLLGGGGDGCEGQAVLASPPGSVLFRSFDLKTRATLAIRHNVENYEHYTDYRIVQLWGEENSFEREFYDMIRSAFIKYGCQSRIGRMAGIMVAYHNTREMFGFEFVPQEHMDRLVYGSVAMADFAFDSSLKLLDATITRILEDYPDCDESLQLLFKTCEQGFMEVFVVRHQHLDAVLADPIAQRVYLKHYRVLTDSFLNSKRALDYSEFRPGDHLDVNYSVFNVGGQGKNVSTGCSIASAYRFVRCFHEDE